MTQSLQRISRYLRDLLLSMAGKPVNPDSDTEHEGFVDPEELSALLDALADPSASTSDAEDQTTQDAHCHPELEVCTDWASEREDEIARLEKENEELRKVLGIDRESIAASGIDVETEIRRMDRRRPELKQRRRDAAVHMSAEGGDQWDRTFNNNTPVYMWDTTKPPGNTRNNQSPPPPYTQEVSLSGGAPLQRSMELPTLRTGLQPAAGPRGAGPGPQRLQLQQQLPQQRGTWLSSAGRGRPPSSQWTTWVPSPSIQLHSGPLLIPPEDIDDRPWPIQGGSGMDISR